MHVQHGGSKPKITGPIIDAIAKARAEQGAATITGTVSALITAFRGSPEFTKLARKTQTGYLWWLEHIERRFGKARLGVFNDRRVRGDIIEWRDGWADKPRSADQAIQVLSRLLSWAVERGRLDRNLASGISKLYESDRADIIWTQEHFDAFKKAASVEVQEGVELAACTGLRRADLVEVPWDAVGPHAIIWKTKKSRGRARIVVPLLPETRALLARIKARHAEEMEKLPSERRRELPPTILSNSRWQPWTAMGFGSRFNDAKRASGIEVHLHDVRGTFATRCMLKGLTDQEIADILGWSSKDVSTIRVKYVDQARIVVGIAERLAAN